MVSQNTISTFTDSDCPYCRKMHKEIGQLSDAGVRVRYMLFPRTEVGSPSYVSQPLQMTGAADSYVNCKA